MRQLCSIPLAFLALAAIVILPGCTIGPPTTVKDRGVYTTIAMTERELDLPNYGYTAHKHFGPDQAPAAVIVGYGYWEGTVNRPQQFNLQLIESATGTIIYENSGDEDADRAAVMDLPIRKSGDYQLKLIINNSVYDMWDFSLDRGGTAETVYTNAAPPTYAKGTFSVVMEGHADDDFMDYDNYFLPVVNNAVSKAANNAADQTIFSQVPPGKVVIRFQLDDAGRLNAPEIVQNTLNEALGKFFLEVLQSRSPYRMWTGNSHSREMKVTFYFE